jgi:hypothetical protein
MRPDADPCFSPQAPFPNSGFANSYNGSAPYKGSGSAPAGRTFNRSRYLNPTLPQPLPTLTLTYLNPPTHSVTQGSDAGLN